MTIALLVLTDTNATTMGFDSFCSYQYYVFYKHQAVL